MCGAGAGAGVQAQASSLHSCDASCLVPGGRQEEALLLPAPILPFARGLRYCRSRLGAKAVVRSREPGTVQ